MSRTRSTRAAALPAGCALALGLCFPAFAQDDVFFEDPAGLRSFDPLDFSASGEIDRVDLPRGRLIVDGRVYRADPRALQGLEPGQQVFLTYEPFEDQAWISDLRLDDEGLEGEPDWGVGF